MEYFKSGYNVGYKNVLLAVDYMAQNAVISPITSEGVYRIVLSWSSLPYDLDSHLTGPLPESLQESANGENGRFHMYYPYAEANEGSLFPEYVALDLDNTDIVDLPYVPETTTIRQMLNGTYRYSVHDFSNSGDETSTDLSSSNAKVEVFKGSTLIQTYHVPSNIAGTIWNVFELSGDQLTPLNRFTNGNADDASKY